jgi:hypothetical protein
MEDSVVKKSLFEFLQERIDDIKLEDIDEIVLNYVVGILEDLTSNYSVGDEESFDVDAFCEMLTAYLPQTSTIPQTQRILHLPLNNWTSDLLIFQPHN